MSNVTSTENRVLPARLTDNDTGAVYELDFSRESVAFAERNDFDLEKALKYPVTGISNLFFYSFRKNHRNVSREKTEKLLEKWGGMPEKLLNRLIQLYQQAQTSNTVQTDEDAEKNASVTLEL